METIRRSLLAIAVVFANALPASAQATTTAPGDFHGVLFVWVWILVVGVIVFVVGTSLGVGAGNKR